MSDLEPPFWANYRPTPLNWGQVRSIVLYQGKNLGDVLVSMPLLSKLQALAPSAIIQCIAQPMSHNILTSCHVATLSCPRSAIDAICMGWSVRRQPPELFIDLHGSLESEILSRLCHARTSIQVVGCKTRGLGFYTHKVPFRTGTRRHRIDLNLDILRHLGVAVSREDRKIDCSGMVRKGSASSHVQDILRADRYLVIHPTSRWLFKSPPPDFWCALIAWLQSRSSTSIYLTGLNTGLEGEFLRYLAEQTGVVNLAGKLDVCELAAVINGAVGYLGVDTFASHIAVGLDKPGIVLFGPSDEAAWGPSKDSRMGVVTSEEYACRPCNLDGCAGSKRSDCLSVLNPKHVADQLLEKLS